jgi:hypothetical protein
MYTPSAHGGHARYAHELMTALARDPRRSYRYELVTSEDLHDAFRSDLYEVHAILPPLLHRRNYSNRITWATSRLANYPRREWKYHHWLRSRPEVPGFNFK